MFATMLVAGLLAQNADELALIRYDLTKPAKKAGLFLIDLASGNGAPYASDVSFMPQGGARPAIATFGIDLNGDRVDEIGVIREQVSGKGRYSLSFHGAPKTLFANVSIPSVKPQNGALGTRAQFGAIVDADGIDLDGDLRDELMVLRRVESGLQRLDVFETPAAGASLGAPIASYLDLGIASQDAVLHVVAIDIDGDAKEEIAFVRKDSTGVLRVDVASAPKQVGATFVGAIASAPISGGGDVPVFVPVADVDASDVNDDGIDELLVLRQFLGFQPATIEFGDRIDVHSLPTNGQLSIVAPSIPVGSFGAAFPVGEVVVLRGKGAKPGIDASAIPLKDLLTADYSLSVQVATSVGGYGSGGMVTVGPILDFEGEFVEVTHSFRLESPTAGDIGGALDEIAGAVILADGTMTVPVPFSATDVLHLQFKNLKVHKVGTKVAVFGDVGGSIETPFSTLPIVVGSIFGLSQ